MAYNPTKNELWVASSAQTDAGTTLATITIINAATFTGTGSISLNASSAGYNGIVFAPDLGKAYVSSQTTPDGGFAAEIDEIDVTTHAIKTVTPYQSAIDGPLGMAYDPVQKRVYVSVDDAHYIFVIDATTDTLVTTYPAAAAGDSGISGFGNIVVDPTGNYLYMATGDKNSYPMVATMPVDGGLPFDVLGGQAAGWVGEYGLALVPTDAGSVGATVIKTKDAGSFVQFIDPGQGPTLHATDTPKGILNLKGTQTNTTVGYLVSVQDNCTPPNTRIREFNAAGTEVTNSKYTDVNQFQNWVQIDPANVTGSVIHVAANFQPAPSTSSGGGTSNNSVSELTIDLSASPAPECP